MQRTGGDTVGDGGVDLAVAGGGGGLGHRRAIGRRDAVALARGAWLWRAWACCARSLRYAAEAQAQAAAEAVIAQARAEIVAAEARRADDSAFGGAGSLAALAGEKLDLLAPYCHPLCARRGRG